MDEDALSRHYNKTMSAHGNEMVVDENGMEEPPEGKSPAEFSEDEDPDDPKKKALHKQALLEWLTEADFTGEMSLAKIAAHKFKLDDEEMQAMIGTEGILKICKT